MKVFISWSQNSREFAGALNSAMERLFDTVETFYSPEIPAGEQWLNMIEEELSNTDFGIICITKGNQKAQWLNYEAGALSRQVSDRRKRLGVILLDFDEKNDVDGPFKNFQMKMATIEEFKSLMKSLNELGPNVKDDVLNDRIDREWPKLEEELTKLKMSPDEAPIPDRSIDDKVDELLGLVRDFDKASTPPVITSFAVPADVRLRGRTFVSKLYMMTKGRDIRFDFRAINETTDMLDITASMSEQEKRTISSYYRVFFPESARRLIIADVAWKDAMIISADEVADTLLSPEPLGSALSS
ncbi:toll/interleukin-1 receptor domain-containing protein [Pseudarthrobacter sp. MDT3-28]|uniref:toll/interleukin-1 receptor domain-containing protein n=1 Tax=Pseudarthrobacter raffinosi TaxID=2953651 RepID=UPI00208E4540|nr:toll/interleukin-1 receptor domain-containing protein [Pseudarthrobacter sp. MDT3-28]MCO4238000.1 toll/interleukin-1 receptor domain-containing protein [Pseudarthrobacter sp. MDT3-28]